MKKLLLAASLLIATSLIPHTANANENDPAIGYWLTENGRAVINMNQCGQELCGTVYWIIEGGMEFDEKNPVSEMRTRKICGLQVVNGLEKEADGEWENGNIYKADDGDTYSADVNVQQDGTLKVRGYLGVSWLGKTQIWKRVDALNYQQCL